MNHSDQELQNEIVAIRKMFEKQTSMFERHYQDDLSFQKQTLDRFSKSEEDSKASHKEIIDKLDPIADLYRSTSTMGKWVMAGAVFLSIILGIILSLKSLKN